MAPVGIGAALVQTHIMGYTHFRAGGAVVVHKKKTATASMDCNRYTGEMGYLGLIGCTLVHI